MSSDRRGTGAASSISSERSRMKPTWGPLPWVTTTRQPAATRAPACRAVARAFSNCSAMVPRWPSRMRELPPTAITALRSMASALHGQPPAELAERRAEARQRRPRESGADLADAGLTMRDTGIDERRHTALDDAARVNRRWRADEAQRRQCELGVARQRDPVHLARVADGVLG